MNILLKSFGLEQGSLNPLSALATKFYIKNKITLSKTIHSNLVFSGCSRLRGPSRHDEKIRLDRKKSLHGLDQPQTSTFYKIIEVYIIKLEKAAIFEPFKQCANLADSTLSLS